jgi:enamine deaminase RidA (YjgF/YER057c/UK114 family)
MARRNISSGSPYEAVIGFSRAVVTGGTVSVSGTAPIMPDGGDPPADAYLQAVRCWQIVTEALREAGSGPEQVIRTRTYLIDAADWEAVGRAHGEVFADIRPASTMIVVRGFLDPRWRVEVEADAVID